MRSLRSWNTELLIGKRNLKLKEVVKLNVKCFTFAVNSRKKRKIKIAKNKKRII